MKKVNEKLTFAFLVFIVLGQLPGFFLDRIYKLPFTFHPLDFFLIIFALLGILKIRKPLPLWVDAGIIFGLFGLFSWTIYFVQGNTVTYQSLLYLIRFVSFVFASYFFVSFRRDKELLLKSVGIAGVGISILGWLQYFLVPDIRTLKIYGWDDHLFRLTGSYLDPAFTGILLVISVIIFVDLFLKKKNKYIGLAILFLGITILFTYSRSSYLALFAGIFSYGLFTKYKKILIVLLILLTIPFLPRPSSEGVKLERLHSIYLKIENTKQGIEIFKSNPLVGVGFNNICQVKNIKTLLPSHSCYGLDNSIVLVMVTTGVIGTVLFLNMLLLIFRSTASRYKGVILSLGSAILIHSMFTNTLFYIGVLSVLTIIIGVTREN